MDLTILSLLAFLATIWFLTLKSVLVPTSKNQNPLPTPPALPVIGHLHLLKEPLQRSLEAISHRIGPVFGLRIGRTNFLVVSSPDALEECFTRNDVIFANRPRFVPGEIIGYNFTTLTWVGYGDLWRTLRRVFTVGALSSQRLLMSAKIRENEARMAARKLLNGSGERVDLNEACLGVLKNVVFRVLVGKSWDQFGAPVEIFAASKAITMCDFFPVLRWLGVGKLEEKGLRAVQLGRDRFLQGLLDDRRKERDTTSTSCLVDELLLFQNKEPQLYTDDICKGILLVMLTAGTESSARTMEWAMSLLLNHPTTFEKARDEIDSRIGTSRLVSDSDLSDLPFLRCVVNETLRLLPVGPLLVPHCSSADTSISGYHVPRGTVVVVNAWALHHDPSVWEDPLAFKPERFEGEDRSGLGLGFRFMSFGAGRRVCPGLNLAMRTMMLTLATWIQCLEFESAEGGAVDMEEKGISGIVMTKRQHLRVICKPRSCMLDVLSQL